jgi:hypothetical protein
MIGKHVTGYIPDNGNRRIFFIGIVDDIEVEIDLVSRLSVDIADGEFLSFTGQDFIDFLLMPIELIEELLNVDSYHRRGMRKKAAQAVVVEMHIQIAVYQPIEETEPVEELDQNVIIHLMILSLMLSARERKSFSTLSPFFALVSDT